MPRYVKTVITLTVIHDSTLPIDCMELSHIAREMEEGEVIGAMTQASSTPIPDGEIRRGLMAVGNDGEFFNFDEESSNAEKQTAKA